jgi:beta-ureidopropionase / N-carbamoyl-L-amino-acid hydrolase
MAHLIELEKLNGMSKQDFVTALGSIFEHSPWVPERVAQMRPFASALALHRVMCDAVLQAEVGLQLELIRAHPELAGRAALRGDLTAASTKEQKGAGLAACTPSQLASIQSLNSQYGQRFGFPFVLAVKGHTVDTVIASLAERLTHDANDERNIAIREICRIARFRLADLIDEPTGSAIVAMADDLATFSEDSGALTCTYLTAAHRATAARIRDFMMAAGLVTHIDAVGNVVGVMQGAATGAAMEGTAMESGAMGGGSKSRRVLTGSHYDTVINAGKYDGRLGIVLPIAVAGSLRRAGVMLPYTLEIIAFSEEEGVRFKSPFLGSRAIAGRFDPSCLDNVDASGATLSEILGASGHDVAAIPAIAHDASQVACFVEVHIEQGPVLLEAAQPLGVVTSIAGSIRSIVTVEGLGGHAGTVPMTLRRDALAAAAEMVLAVERRCSEQPGLVGTVGKLEVPGGAINVIPGRCEFSIDIRSESDALRDAAVADVGAAIDEIAARRGVAVRHRRVLQSGSVPCTPALQDAWAASIARVTGGRASRLPSGAGHDAMIMAGLTGIGMLFVRCGNGGISHHPDETLSVADADIAARVFQDFLLHFQVA